ncbi:carbohydrate-binding module family 1 protein [Tulasnella calospora MUT 4182]|uniref:Carbohydrate-binding module family 1 protein n=1 Tax=Tulasnella calospora MUT 4182 TaxID=1051891 RepID=A0A0C3LLH4_9AGAM|nr:carbohydrate-binding module family 1 protein [Tulasnella calospora MUT 4182]
MTTITFGVPAEVTASGYTQAAPWVHQFIQIPPPWDLELSIVIPPFPDSGLNHPLKYMGTCKVYGEAIIVSKLRDPQTEGITCEQQETPAKMEIRFRRIKPEIKSLLPGLTRHLSKSCQTPIGTMSLLRYPSGQAFLDVQRAQEGSPAKVKIAEFIDLGRQITRTLGQTPSGITSQPVELDLYLIKIAPALPPAESFSWRHPSALPHIPGTSLSLLRNVLDARKTAVQPSNETPAATFVAESSGYTETRTDPSPVSQSNGKEENAVLHDVAILCPKAKISRTEFVQFLKELQAFTLRDGRLKEFFNGGRDKRDPAYLEASVFTGLPKTFWRDLFELGAFWSNEEKDRSNLQKCLHDWQHEEKDTTAGVHLRDFKKAKSPDT